MDVVTWTLILLYTNSDNVLAYDRIHMPSREACVAAKKTLEYDFRYSNLHTSCIVERIIDGKHIQISSDGRTTAIK